MLSRVLLSAALLLALVGVTLVGQQPPPAGPGAGPAPVGGQPPAAATPEEEIVRALEQRVSLDVVSKPLAEVLDELGKKVGLRIRLDQAGLNDVGLGKGATVSQKFSNLPLKSVLRNILAELGLAYTIRDEVLVVTSPEEATTQLQTRIFVVRDLVEPDLQIDGVETPPYNFDFLIDLITSSAAPTTWDEVGGPGAIAGQGVALTVSQDRANMEEIEATINVLRRARDVWKQWDGKHRVPALIQGQSLSLSDSAEETRIARVLKEKAEWNKTETPLAAFLDEVAQRHQITIRLDRKALQDAAIRPDVPVTDQAEGVSLRAGLRRLLRELDLAFTIRDDVLLVTTRDEANTRLTLRAYPIFDLVEESFGPPDNTQVPFVTSRAGNPAAAGIAAGGTGIPTVGPPSVTSVIPVVGDKSIGPAAQQPGIPRDPALENTPLCDADWLIDLITSSIEPTHWDVVGGPGGVALYLPSRILVVSASDEAHAGIEALLARLREVTPVPAKMNQKLLDDYERKVIPVVFLVAADSAERPMPEAKEVAEAIRATVAPEIWNQPGHSVMPLRGRVRIVAPRKTQRAIDKFLRELGVLAPVPSPAATPRVQGGFGAGGFGL